MQVHSRNAKGKDPVSGPGREAASDAETAIRNKRRRSVSRLPRLLVGRVLAAVSAEFLVLDPAGLLLLVLGGRVVAPLAVGALQRNNVSHGVALQFCDVRTLLCRACDRD